MALLLVIFIAVIGTLAVIFGLLLPGIGLKILLVTVGLLLLIIAQALHEENQQSSTGQKGDSSRHSPANESTENRTHSEEGNNQRKRISEVLSANEDRYVVSENGYEAEFDIDNGEPTVVETRGNPPSLWVSGAKNEVREQI